ncbi:MAG: FAD-dependent oxidoreductase, partial [Lachnospiraceae bacterium]|nr:FAD-dependent oxidoreductase [Lachnospiraceae bacterium]
KVVTDKNEYEAACVINAAGREAGKISEMAGAETIEVIERKGEYTLYDRNLGGFVSKVMFQCPNEDGKGILVSPTAEGNLLLGPNSIPLKDDEKGNTATTAAGQAQIFNQGRKTCPNLPFGGAITGFAGIRAVSGKDFIIGPSKKVEGFIQVAGICSPGLTSAPAIAEDVAQMALKAAGLEAEAKENWIDEREGIPSIRDMSWEEREALCKQDPALRPHRLPLRDRYRRPDPQGASLQGAGSDRGRRETPLPRRYGTLPGKLLHPARHGDHLRRDRYPV